MKKIWYAIVRACLGKSRDALSKEYTELQEEYIHLETWLEESGKFVEELHKYRKASNKIWGDSAHLVNLEKVHVTESARLSKMKKRLIKLAHIIAY